MTDRDEKRITAVRANGSPYKLDIPGTWWVAPVTYTLEDGSEIDGTQGRYSTKKAAVAGVEHADTKAGLGNVAAIYRDGAFIGTQTTYSLRPGGYGLK